MQDQNLEFKEISGPVRASAGAPNSTAYNRNTGLATASIKNGKIPGVVVEVNKCHLFYALLFIASKFVLLQGS